MVIVTCFGPTKDKTLSILNVLCRGLDGKTKLTIPLCFAMSCSTSHIHIIYHICYNDWIDMFAALYNRDLAITVCHLMCYIVIGDFLIAYSLYPVTLIVRIASWIGEDRENGYWLDKEKDPVSYCLI